MKTQCVLKQEPSYYSGLENVIPFLNGGKRQLYIQHIDSLGSFAETNGELWGILLGCVYCSHGKYSLENIMSGIMWMNTYSVHWCKCDTISIFFSNVKLRTVLMKCSVYPINVSYNQRQISNDLNFVFIIIAFVK